MVIGPLTDPNSLPNGRLSLYAAYSGLKDLGAGQQRTGDRAGAVRQLPQNPSALSEVPRHPPAAVSRHSARCPDLVHIVADSEHSCLPHPPADSFLFFVKFM